MFQPIELALNDLPDVPYPYNRKMGPEFQRLHWVMARLNPASRPSLVPVVRKVGVPMEFDGHEFVMSLPTADPAYLLGYFCKGKMSNEFRLALAAIQGRC